IMLKPKNLALFALALLPIAAVAQMPTRAAAHAETANERQTQVTAIEQLLKQFHDAVVTHDGATLSGLFLPDASLWLNVLSDTAYDRAQAMEAKDAQLDVRSYPTFGKSV